jgi:hypothetical protein
MVSHRPRHEHVLIPRVMHSVDNAFTPRTSTIEAHQIPVTAMTPDAVDIVKDVTVSELKGVIRDCLESMSIVVPELDCIRLSQCTGSENQPKAIYKLPLTTLAQAHISQDAHILITVLPEPEVQNGHHAHLVFYCLTFSSLTLLPLSTLHYLSSCL